MGHPGDIRGTQGTPGLGTSTLWAPRPPPPHGSPKLWDPPQKGTEEPLGDHGDNQRGPERCWGTQGWGDTQGTPETDRGHPGDPQPLGEPVELMDTLGTPMGPSHDPQPWGHPGDPGDTHSTPIPRGTHGTPMMGAPM